MSAMAEKRTAMETGTKTAGVRLASVPGRTGLEWRIPPSTPVVP